MKLVLKSALLLTAMIANPGCTPQDPTVALLSTLQDPGATLADVAAWLEGGADLNARTEDRGQTPLHLAAEGSENPAIIAALVDAGADPNARNQLGLTPLHEAAGHSTTPATIVALLEAGADPNARNENGQTPLHSAAAFSENPAISAALLEAGADPNARNENGETPLHAAAQHNETPGIITALVHADADPNARAEYGITPLHAAAQHSENPAIIVVLLEAGADLSARAEYGFTPLHVAAASSENGAIITALLVAGGDSEAGFTSLHAAAFSENPEIIVALLEAGADPNARAVNGETPVDVIPEDSQLKGTDADRRLTVSSNEALPNQALAQTQEEADRRMRATQRASERYAERAAQGIGLEEARRRAVAALRADPTACPEIVGGGFSTGISAQRNGTWYLRARCTDDAHLAIVSRSGVTHMRCREALSQGMDCERPWWLEERTRNVTQPEYTPLPDEARQRVVAELFADPTTCTRPIGNPPDHTAAFEPGPGRSWGISAERDGTWHVQVMCIDQGRGLNRYLITVMPDMMVEYVHCDQAQRRGMDCEEPWWP